MSQLTHRTYQTLDSKSSYNYWRNLYLAENISIFLQKLLKFLVGNEVKVKFLYYKNLTFTYKSLSAFMFHKHEATFNSHQ